GLLIAFACKKSSTTTTPPANNNNNTVTTNTTSLNFSVNGTAASYPTAIFTPSGSSMVILAIDVTGYPQVQITFPGTSLPINGTYTITSGTPAGNHCKFLLTPLAGTVATASSGVVTVVAATTPSNTAYFTNIICTGTGTTSATYTVSGAAKY
ncbi:MAG TPA: hypothetical protein VF411_10490, partial [Bacteroidia bacterium]